MAQKQEPKSYLADAISSLSPWSSRSTTPNSSLQDKDKDNTKAADKNTSLDGAAISATSAAAGTSDHSVSHWHSLSAKKYPKDCPRLNAQWFHAVDIALRKPKYINTAPPDQKSTPAPKKWMAFSARDSTSLEQAFQKLLEEEEISNTDGTESQIGSGSLSHLDDASKNVSNRPHLRSNRSMEHFSPRTENFPKVPVNEDYLFDVDIKNRELGPAYWLGPVYAVRRGTWFFVEGTTVKPCDENLAFQLEEGYLKMKPWKITSPETASSSQQSQSQDSANPMLKTRKTDASGIESPKATSSSQAPPTPLTHRLFGSYMNSIVTYENENTAWLLSDDFLSRMSGSVYQRFAGGAHLSGTKVLRGYQDLTKKSAPVKDNSSAVNPSNAAGKASEKSDEGRVVDTSSDNLDKIGKDPAKDTTAELPDESTAHESQRTFLERQISNLVISSYYPDRKIQDEEARKREEKEIRDDYRDTPGDDQDRPVDHLLLVTHGIGQRLGARFETFNFIHDVNELRKTVKKVYSDSQDLQALNGEVEKPTKNCRIQVLPISWRHLLEFPHQRIKEKSKEEHDLAEPDDEPEQTYPSLEDITVEGVPALRGILVDLTLDILLYQTPAYKDHISRVVTKECNRILNLFKQRNPSFNGKVSFLGHSLGSAVLFDLLCMQPDDPASLGQLSKRQSGLKKDMKLDFDVENMICIGSPLGLFQMLNGRTISGRSTNAQVTLDGSKAGIQDPFELSFAKEIAHKGQEEQESDVLSSSPKCRQLYNIFHPTDPVGYRLEPLISQSMSSLQPQNLPYTKGGFLGAPIGHGLTGIPAKMGQSFSDMWSSFSSGLASNFINKSLGISAEDAAKMSENKAIPPLLRTRSQSLSQIKTQPAGAGTNITAGGVIPGQWQSPVSTPAPVAEARRRKLALETAEAEKAGANLPTLIDSELETLYAGFQTRGDGNKSSTMDSNGQGGSKSWRESEARGRRLKREEAKVRALNTNGRVDYKIQEGAFDISFLQSIASHLAYWTDEDVCHFLVSQMLAQQRGDAQVKKQ